MVTKLHSAYSLTVFLILHYINHTASQRVKLWARHTIGLTVSGTMRSGWGVVCIVASSVAKVSINLWFMQYNENCVCLCTFLFYIHNSPLNHLSFCFLIFGKKNKMDQQNILFRKILYAEKYWRTIILKQKSGFPLKSGKDTSLSFIILPWNF